MAAAPKRDRECLLCTYDMFFYVHLFLMFSFFFMLQATGAVTRVAGSIASS